MALTKRCLVLFLVLITLFTLSYSDSRINHREIRKKRAIEYGDDIRGPYCETRPVQQCCPGRDDSCTVPILGTVCYCDIFCNETADDCCPDFWRHCMGIDPRPIRQACERDGVPYPLGAILRDNCNECTCSRDPRNPDRFAFRCTNNVCLIQPNIIRAVNDDNRYGWRASNYSQFWGLTLAQGSRLRLGTMPPDTQVMRMIPIQMQMVDELPRSFDSRQKWPGYVHPVRDQGNCGASWAFSTAAVASDRLAIESEGILTEELSPQHLLACNRVRGQRGCDGGYLDKAWWFLRRNGLVSDDCYPYERNYYEGRETCRMPSNDRSARCPNGRSNRPERILKSTPPYRISSNEKEIMMEIMKNGPVQATMRVKEDFFMYNSGIYRHTNTGPDNMPIDGRNGYHSVRIIGWGEDRISTGELVKYWICGNSWGKQWGENGFFPIKRSCEDCGLESFIVASCVFNKTLGHMTYKHTLDVTNSNIHEDSTNQPFTNDTRAESLDKLGYIPSISYSGVPWIKEFSGGIFRRRRIYEMFLKTKKT